MVTLCAASSVNLPATLEALVACTDQIKFAECLLFTDADVAAPPSIRVVRTPRLESGRDYSHFLLHDLVGHVRTSHCLVVQWDGFVLDAAHWEPGFLDYDYIGSPWPQFHDGHDVGNGGFSLRSLRLLKACQDPRFKDVHPEDVAICRMNRALLEDEHGIRFADHATAGRFAYERSQSAGPTFGFHGAFNMIPVLGPERFWDLYLTLDDRETVFRDYALFVRQLRAESSGWRLPARLTWDRLQEMLGGSARLRRQAT
jgi:hypothetical protein